MSREASKSFILLKYCDLLSASTLKSVHVYLTFVFYLIINYKITPIVLQISSVSLQSICLMVPKL